MADRAALIEKFESREATVAVIGLGYVGLPLAVVFAEAGFRVVGIDVDEEKVAKINRGESYIEDVPSERLAALVGSSTSDVQSPKSNSQQPLTAEMHANSQSDAVDVGLWTLDSELRTTLTATADYDALHDADAVIICVPTPLNKTGDPDISYIVAATEEIAKRLHEDMVIVLESTTYPGTTEEVILPRLEAALAEHKVRKNGQAAVSRQPSVLTSTSLSPPNAWILGARTGRFAIRRKSSVV